MPTVIERHMTSVLSVALMVYAVWPAMAVSAIEDIPVVVVSISNANDILENVKFIGEVTDSPIADFQAILGTDLVQLMDDSRAAGIIVTTNGNAFKTLGFLPVANQEKFLELIKECLGEPMEAGDSLYEIIEPFSLFVKRHNGWTYLSPSSQTLEELPDDPVPMLEGLESQYDVAVRAHVNNIPGMFRQLALGWLQFGVQEQLSQLDGLDDPRSEFQRTMTQNSVAQFNALVNETDSFTVGWDIDARTTQFDCAITAVEGTQAAQRMNKLQASVTQFGGFLLPDAAVSLRFSNEMHDADTQQTVGMLNAIRDQAVEQLAQDDQLPHEQAREESQQILSRIFGIVSAAVETGRVDGGAALIVEPGLFSFAAGISVADGRELEDTLKNLIQLANQDGGFPEISWNLKECHGVNFHTFQMPITDSTVAAVVGKQVDVVVGTGEQRSFFAFGVDSQNLLQRILDRSEAVKSEPMPPSQMTVAVTPLLEFAESLSGDIPGLSQVSAALATASGNDRIIMENQPSKNGVITRITVEEDVWRYLAPIFKLIAQQAMQAVPANMGPINPKF